MSTPQNAQQELFEAAWRTRLEAEQFGWDEHFEPAPLASLLGRPGVPRHGRALDIGCGGGQAAIWLAERGFDVTAFDISETAVELARANAGRAGVALTTLRGDMAEPGVLNGARFVLAVDHHTLHCVLAIDSYLANVARVLRPSGRYALVCDVGLPRDRAMRRSLDPTTGANPLGMRVFRTRTQIEDAVRAAGLAVESSDVLAGEEVDRLVLLARRVGGAERHPA